MLLWVGLTLLTLVSRPKTFLRKSSVLMSLRLEQMRAYRKRIWTSRRTQADLEETYMRNWQVCDRSNHRKISKESPIMSQKCEWSSTTKKFIQSTCIRICSPCQSKIIMGKTSSREVSLGDSCLLTTKRLSGRKHSNVLIHSTQTQWVNSVSWSHSRRRSARGSYLTNSTNKEE